MIEGNLFPRQVLLGTLFNLIFGLVATDCNPWKRNNCQLNGILFGLS